MKGLVKAAAQQEVEEIESEDDSAENREVVAQREGTGVVELLGGKDLNHNHLVICAVALGIQTFNQVRVAWCFQLVSCKSLHTYNLDE